MITQERLKEILDYNSETGILTYKISTNNRIHIGDIVRCRRPDGYLSIQIDNKRYLVHRIIWFWVTGKWPKYQIDHINGIENDNRWCNLREATNQQNNFNKGMRKNNTSGKIGVYRHNRKKPWAACIVYAGKTCYLGSFYTKEEAYAAYCEAALKYFGEFANFG